jgi:hypothetical protein
MKRKRNTLEILAFVCIIVTGTLIYFGLKNKSALKNIYKPHITVPQAAVTETQKQERIPESTNQVAVASVKTSQVSAAVLENEKKKPEPEQESKDITLILRSGKKISGTIAARDDSALTLHLETGTTNIAWRTMSTNSFHQLHPELYNRLLERLLARRRKKDEEMRSKGYIQYNGEWLTKKEMLAKKYRFANQRITTTVRSGQFKQADKSPDGSSRQDRDEQGVLMISFRGFEPEAAYELKVEGSQYLEYRNWSRGVDVPRHTSNTISKTETLLGKDEYTFEYEFPAYKQYKGSARSSYRYGYESEDFAVKVWLDGELIYEKPEGTFEEYLIIDSF